ncbi:MAG: antitoxin VapB family protein [Promethearchaeota archaeon]
MTQKTISLNKKSHSLLKSLKGEKETYSELIIRLCQNNVRKKKEDILLKYAGAFKENSDEWETIQDEIRASRDSHLTTEE